MNFMSLSTGCECWKKLMQLHCVFVSVYSMQLWPIFNLPRSQRPSPQASQLGTQQRNSRCCAHDVGHNWRRNGNKVTYHVNCHGLSCASWCQRVIIATFLLGESIGRWLELAKSAAFIHLSLHVRCSYVLFLHRASRLCSGWCACAEV